MSKLKEDNIMICELSDLSFEILFSHILNLRPLSKEISCCITSSSIRDNIYDNPCKDWSFLVTIKSVDVIDLVWDNTILQRCFKIELKSVTGSTFNHRQSSIRCRGKFDCVQFDIIPLEWVTKSDELNTMFISFVLYGLEPLGVIEANFIVAQNR